MGKSAIQMNIIPGKKLILLLAAALCFFTSEILSGAVHDISSLQDSAVLNSGELRSLRSDAQKSMIQLAEAKAGRRPEISFLASGTYIFNPMDAVIPIMEAQEPTYYQFAVNIAQPIFTWGKIRNAVELHERLAEAASLQVQKKEREVRTRTAVLVHSLMQLSTMKEAVSRQYELALRLSDIAEESFEQGFIVEEEVITARISAQELKLVHHDISRRRDTLLRELASLTGIAGLGAGDIAFPPQLEMNSMQVGGLDFLIEEALSQQRESIRILKLLEEVQELSLKISQGSVYWKPDIGLQVEVGYQGSRAPFIESGWFQENDYKLNVTVAVETSIWDGGRRIQEIRAKEQDLESSRISLDRAKQEITDELIKTFLQYQVNLSRMEYNSLKEESYSSRISFARRQYDSGVGSEASLLTLQVESLGHSLQSCKDRIEAVGTYYKILSMTGAM